MGLFRDKAFGSWRDKNFVGGYYRPRLLGTVVQHTPFSSVRDIEPAPVTHGKPTKIIGHKKKTERG